MADESRALGHVTALKGTEAWLVCLRAGESISQGMLNSFLDTVATTAAPKDRFPKCPRAGHAEMAFPHDHTHRFFKAENLALFPERSLTELELAVCFLCLPLAVTSFCALLVLPVFLACQHFLLDTSWGVSGTLLPSA